MAFEDTNTGSPFTMPVAPMYGGNGNGFGFGGDWAWIILLLVLCGGWGNGFGNGFGGGEIYPWLNNSQNINGGFRDQMLQTSVSSIGDRITSGFGDVQTALCGGFAGTTAAVTGAQNALAQQLYTNQISDMERSFAAQTASTAGMSALQAQLAQCCCDNRAATADLKYTIASEECATRASATAHTQSILDKLCQLELDGYRRENESLRSQLTDARFAASQQAQTAQILAGQAAEIDGVYNRLKNCPVGTYSVCNPVTPVGCGCGM